MDDKAGYIDLRFVVWGLGLGVRGLGFGIQQCVVFAHTSLSKKRVSSEEKTQQSDRFEKAKSVHSIIYSVGAHTGVPVETLYALPSLPLLLFVTVAVTAMRTLVGRCTSAMAMALRACGRSLLTPTYSPHPNIKTDI